MDTGNNGRVIHEVEIDGLDWGTDYEYRVTHTPSGGSPVVFQDTFETRLDAGDTTSYSFAAYGDSADGDSLSRFNVVQNTILNDPNDLKFALLLGDNAYESGLYDEFDLRFETGTAAPTTLDWIAGHIDYSAYGNHDTGNSGVAYKAAYSTPIPISGVNAPVSRPGGSSNNELYYSFDYGDVHYVTFNTNILNSSSGRTAAINYMLADLEASDAKWKVVFGHHPFGGSPDKGEGPEDNYWKTMVAPLYNAGVDLVLMGHSHTYHTTYPLTGHLGNSATFVLDTDFTYDKHDGLVQVTAGTGGTGLRSGSFSSFNYVAQGYTTSDGRINGSTSGVSTRAVDGYARVTVQPDKLVVDYISGASGNKVSGSQTVTIMAGAVFTGGPGPTP